MAYSFTHYLTAARLFHDDTLTEAVSKIDAAKKLASSWRTLAAQLERDHEPHSHAAVQVYDDCAGALEACITRGMSPADTNKLIQDWDAATGAAHDLDERDAYDSCATGLRDLTSH